MSRLSSSESKFLKCSPIASTISGSHPGIKALLADYGMDANKLLEGKELYVRALAVKERHDQEGMETHVSSDTYRDAFEKLQSLFKRYPDLTRIFIKRQPEVLIRLGVTRNFLLQYYEFFDQFRHFYHTIHSNPNLLEKLNLLKMIPEVVADCLSRHQELLDELSVFIKESVEYQEANLYRNRSKMELKEWMEDFAPWSKPRLRKATAFGGVGDIRQKLEV